jgi:hypothetical protein
MLPSKPAPYALGPAGLDCEVNQHAEQRLAILALGFQLHLVVSLQRLTSVSGPTATCS